MSLISPALPKGSLILVTGANGYIGSHVVDQLLKLGYNVRGTIQNEKPWIEILFSKRRREHGSSAGNFEAVVIEDIAKQGAFNHVIEGVSGIVHVAADLSFDTNAEKVISFAVAANINILSVAAANHTIKRVVLTSSSTACNIAKPFEPTVVITHDTWNNEITYLVKTMQTNLPGIVKGYLIYAASKTASEQQAWKYMEEKKPSFVLNTILPSMNLGTISDQEALTHPAASRRLDRYNNTLRGADSFEAFWLTTVVDFLPSPKQRLSPSNVEEYGSLLSEWRQRIEFLTSDLELRGGERWTVVGTSTPKVVFAVVVEPNPEPFIVHKDLLCRHSQFFKNELSEIRWAHGRIYTKRLKDVDREGFGLVASWLYTGEVNLGFHVALFTPVEFAQLWVLGAELMMPKF
ncbi:hypothetical protein G7Y89_g1320 [Cudoniella acicularis]|uniref:BTB domain-containing protein n=1 Tax=Cudoniella acicularis TaxID=354080 RepID=A0A8H4W9N7_9HELO|nr:hypothetical protein G7Y89_g1320 [Cudoniella acicularis]